MSDATSTNDRAPDPGPTVFVLYGATGDLAKRMVLPAFFTLAKEGLLPKDWWLVGNGRGDVSHEDFKGHVKEVLEEFGPKPKDGPWDDFAKRLSFAGGGFSTDDPGSLLDVIAQARKKVGADAQIVHYFAVPPVAFTELTKALGEHDLAKGSRVVYEKPFGTSPDSFRELDEVVHSVLDEKQVYRIDHFLGKEATQNLHVSRFANRLFDTIWSNEHIKSVQIDVPETLNIDDRAGFYDATGAVLDMLVTHLFQITAEIAMDPPGSLHADDLQSAREEVIRSFRSIDPKEVVLGQYDGYRDVEGIAKDSTTDTFVAARIWIDNERWRGVPFLLRTGKCLAESHQTVSILLKDPDGPLDGLPQDGNVLTFQLSGDGAVAVEFVVKRPGPGLTLETGTADLPLDDLAGAEPLPPYSRLIHDVLLGDRSLFTRPDGLSDVWRAATPLLDDPPKIQPYEQGSWGPAAAQKLAAPDHWLLGS